MYFSFPFFFFFFFSYLFPSCVKWVSHFSPITTQVTTDKILCGCIFARTSLKNPGAQWKQLVLSLASNKCKLFSQEKTKNYLAFMTGNSRKVILSREMVKLVLINAAANHIGRSDRCLLKISSAGTHLVVHFSNCAFEMADEFIGPFPNAYPVFQRKSY